MLNMRNSFRVITSDQNDIYFYEIWMKDKLSEMTGLYVVFFIIFFI